VTDIEEVPAIILCGGRGTRISGVNPALPKPLLPIGERPMLWHIMKTYAAHGHRDFVLALGWLGEEIRRYFLAFEGADDEPAWRVTCVDTGVDARTGTRVRLACAPLAEGPVMVTYGDGLADVDVGALLRFHRGHGKLATITSVRPPGRFGELVLEADGRVVRFEEKPGRGSVPINGGFMVFEREAIDSFIPADEDVMLEREPLTGLAAAGQLMAYDHEGFWQPVDTAQERDQLEALWSAGDAPWTTDW
jgi:glucose-1-phosphate cytidylyltransferase